MFFALRRIPHWAFTHNTLTACMHSEEFIVLFVLRRFCKRIIPPFALPSHHTQKCRFLRFFRTVR